MSHPETITVDRVDREAAWPFRPSCYKEDTKERWMAGVYDRAAPVIAAFARHRIAALQAAAERERTLVEAMEQADYEAHLAIEKGIESGAVYWREGLEQVQATLSSALKSTPSSAGRAPKCVACDDAPAPENNPCAVCGAVDEALRAAHQSSSTLVEYLNTPPTIGTADQAIDYALHLHCKPPHA